MPATINFAIPYPCMGPVVNCADFTAYATGIEAAFVTVDAEASAVLKTPYAIQAASATPALAVATTFTFTPSANDFSSGITVAANAFTAVTPGLYAVEVQVSSSTSTLTMTSGRVSILKNAVLVNAFKRKPQVSFPSISVMNLTAAVNLSAGDAITFQYLWTGTGALTGAITAACNIQLLSTP